MRNRLQKLAGGVVLALACVAGAAQASPTWVLGVGTTLAPNGAPGETGTSATLAVLVPFEGRWSFGPAFFVDDQGTGLTELRDPNDGTPLGVVGDLHRWTYGGEWRTEALLHRSKRYEWSWNAGFGYGRQEIDRRGVNGGAVSGVTLSTGTTALLPLAGGHRIGLSLAYRKLAVSTEADPGRTTQWATAALEWRWQGTPKE